MKILRELLTFSCGVADSHSPPPPGEGVKKARNANVELLRCLLMFLIVLHHAAFHGYWKDDSSQWLMVLLFTVLNFWHVDCFIAISGWFGIKFTWKKFLNIWGLIVFYSGVSLAVSLFMGWKISLGSIVTAGWFGGCYLMLMLMSPILNAAIEYLYVQGRSVLVRAWALIMFGVIMNWLPFHGFSSISFSIKFSIMLMIVLYMTARVMQKLELKISKSSCLGVMALCLLGFLMTSCLPVIVLLFLGKNISVGILIQFTSYDAPHVIVMAIVVLYFFVHHIKIPARFSRFVGFCSPAMFGVYLLHEVTSFGRKMYIIPERWLANNTELNPCVIVFLSAMLVFCVCTIIDIARRLLVDRLKLILLIKK